MRLVVEWPPAIDLSWMPDFQNTRNGGLKLFLGIQTLSQPIQLANLEVLFIFQLVIPELQTFRTDVRV